MTVPDETAAVHPGHLQPRAVVETPQKYLSLFLSHWGMPERMPDLSEGRSIEIKKLRFWKNLKCTMALKEHKTLPGLCAKWLHIALDFAISQNKWPVIFTKGEDTFDMTVSFVHCVWVCYCAQMNGSPTLTSKACQKVYLS